jgi:hypothetical protein
MVLAQKMGLLRSAGFFRGFLGQFLGYLEWLGPNHKYFSEIEGHAVIFPNAQGPRQNFQEAQGPKCKMVRNYGFLRFFPMENLVDWVHGVAQVHRRPRRRGQKGTIAVEGDMPDEAVPEGMSGGREAARRRRSETPTFFFKNKILSK